MKLIIDIPDHLYSVIKNKECTHNNVLTEAVLNGTPIPDNATPCDFCRYNPPSSTDGKPCCMCPATGRGK